MHRHDRGSIAAPMDPWLRHGGRSRAVIAGCALAAVGVTGVTGGAGAAGGGDAEIVGRSWQVHDLLPTSGLRGRLILQVEFDTDSTAWLATATGLYSCDGYEWTRYSTADGLPSDFVRSKRICGVFV